MTRPRCSTFPGGSGDGGHDLLYLVDGGGAGEHGLTNQHLCQDTPQAPHVHTLRVPGEHGGIQVIISNLEKCIVLVRLF